MARGDRAPQPGWELGRGGTDWSGAEARAHLHSVILGVQSKGPSQMLGSRPWWPSHGGLPPSGARSLRDLEGGLEAANLGIPNGTPDVKDELIREGKVTEPFIQGLG